MDVLDGDLVGSLSSMHAGSTEVEEQEISARLSPDEVDMVDHPWGAGGLVVSWFFVICLRCIMSDISRQGASNMDYSLLWWYGMRLDKPSMFVYCLHIVCYFWNFDVRELSLHRFFHHLGPAASLDSACWWQVKWTAWNHHQHLKDMERGRSEGLMKLGDLVDFRENYESRVLLKQSSKRRSLTVRDPWRIAKRTSWRASQRRTQRWSWLEKRLLAASWCSHGR